MNYIKIFIHLLGEVHYPPQCAFFSIFRKYIRKSTYLKIILTDGVANCPNRAAISPHGALSFKLKNTP